jgi:hypothetical protein
MSFLKVHTRRAYQAHDIAHKAANIAEHAEVTTMNGKERYLCKRQCPCGRWHWGQREARAIGRQKEVAKLCPDCFFHVYGKNRPKQYRYLTQNEVEGITRKYESEGCKVYHVDPSTL